MTKIETPSSVGSPTFGWLGIVAAVFALAGLAAIAHPYIADVVAGYVIAAVLIVAGIGSLIAGVAGDSGSGKAVNMLFGLLALAGGTYAGLNPLSGAVGLVWVIGAVYSVTGIGELGSAVGIKTNRLWYVLMGLVDLGIGAFLLFSSPEAALQVLAIFIGIGLLFRALMLLFLRRVLSKALT